VYKYKTLKIYITYNKGIEIIHKDFVDYFIYQREFSKSTIFRQYSKYLYPNIHIWFIHSL